MDIIFFSLFIIITSIFIVANGFIVVSGYLHFKQQDLVFPTLLILAGIINIAERILIIILNVLEDLGNITYQAESFIIYFTFALRIIGQGIIFFIFGIKNRIVFGSIFTIVGIAYLLTVGINFIAVLISSFLADPFRSLIIGGIIVYNWIYYLGMDTAYIIEYCLLLIAYLLLFYRCRKINDKYLKLASIFLIIYAVYWLIFYIIDLSIVLSYYSYLNPYLRQYLHNKYGFFF